MERTILYLFFILRIHYLTIFLSATPVFGSGDVLDTPADFGIIEIVPRHDTIINSVAEDEERFLLQSSKEIGGQRPEADADGTEIEHRDALATVFGIEFSLVEIVLDDDQIFLPLHNKRECVGHQLEEVVDEKGETDGKLDLFAALEDHIEDQQQDDGRHIGHQHRTVEQARVEKGEDGHREQYDLRNGNDETDEGKEFDCRLLANVDREELDERKDTYNNIGNAQGPSCGNVAGRTERALHVDIFAEMHKTQFESEQKADQGRTDANGCVNRLNMCS